MSRTCVHQLGVDGEAAGGVDDDHVATRPGGPPRGESPGHLARGRVGSEKTGTSIWRASVRSCSTAAGRWRSAPTSSGLRPCERNHCASLAVVVVLPEPCRPAMSTTVGGRDGVGDLQRLAAEDRDQLLVDGVDDLAGRGRGPGQLEPDAALPHPVLEACGRRVTLTSASSRATRISRSTSSTSSARSVPRLRSRLKMPSNRSESASNMRAGSLPGP